MSLLDDAIPGMADLDERIQINLDKGMTLEAIGQDTMMMIRDHEWTIARNMFQVQIYKDLIFRINQKIYERDKSNIILPRT